MAAAREIPERRRRVKLVAWSGVWLVALISPAAQIAKGRDRPLALAIGAMVAFIGLYLAHWWLTSDPEGDLRTKVVLLAPLTGIALWSSLVFHGTWPFLFFYVSAAVACAVPERLAIFGIAAVALIDAVVVNRPAFTENYMAPQIIGVVMSGLLVMFMVRMIHLIRELNAAREELAKMAVADERLRFSRDLHDLLGHTLSLIVVKSEAVRRLVHNDAEAAARESGDIEMVSRQALAEVREAVTSYRERSLDVELEGARMALLAAGIEATIRQPVERLPATVESLLGWTVREGVTNVVRHSNGRHCEIDLRSADGMAVLEICDDGGAGPGDRLSVDVGAAVVVGGGPAGGGSLGAAPSGEATANGPADGPPGDADARAGAGVVGGGRVGTGLRGLAERLAAAHGRLEAGRRPDGGFRLAVTVPLDQGRGTG